MWDQPGSRPIKEFIFSDVMADICRPSFWATTAFVAFEQFVVKGPEQGMSFLLGTRTSGYVHRPHRPYLDLLVHAGRRHGGERHRVHAAV